MNKNASDSIMFDQTGYTTMSCSDPPMHGCVSENIEWLDSKCVHHVSVPHSLRPHAVETKIQCCKGKEKSSSAQQMTAEELTAMLKLHGTLGTVCIVQLLELIQFEIQR